MLRALRERALTFLWLLALADCTVAYASAEPPAVTVYTLTSGRVVASIGMLAGLAGSILGARALWRSTRDGSTAEGRRAAAVAIVAGLIGSALGGTVVATAAGPVGSGGGRGGAIIAVGVGLIGALCGGLALGRLRER